MIVEWLLTAEAEQNKLMKRKEKEEKLLIKLIKFHPTLY
jgi:hypothetical protein